MINQHKKKNVLLNQRNGPTLLIVLHSVSGGYIYYNEQEGVYEVINCIGEVYAKFKDRWDAVDYARKLLIPDFEVTPYFMAILMGTVPLDPKQEMLDEIIKSMPVPTNN